MAVIVLAALAVPARAQRPTAVAEARHDVNGDGRPDVIRIEDPAAVSLSITGNRAANAWKPFTNPGKLSGGELRVGLGPGFPVPVILAIARFGARDQPTTSEAMVLAWRNGALEEIWRGIVAARGIDVEQNENVELGPHGLLKFQGRPGVERCDGAPAYLFLEKYDWKQRRFRAVAGNLPRVDPRAERMTATRAAPAHATTAPPTVYRRVVASSQANAGSAADLTAPSELIDGDPATAWREGAPGDGRGEFITVRSAMPDATVAAVRIVPGDASSSAAFGRSNRLREVAFLLGSHAVWVDFPKDPAKDGANVSEPYWVTFDPPLPAQCVSVIVSRVYPGSDGDTAIAELAVLTADELAEGGPYPALAARVARGDSGAPSAARTLAQGGDPAARALLDELAKPKRTAAEALRLRRALAITGEPVAVPQLVAALAVPGISPPDREGFTRALTTIGSAAVAPLREVIADERGSVGARVAAAAALGAMDHESATTALLAVAGARDRQVQRAIGLALATTARIWPLLEVAEGHDESGVHEVVWRAIGQIAGRLPEGEARSRVVASISARLSAATEPVGRGDYRLRSRQIEAAAQIEDAGALEAVGAAIGQLGRSPEADAIRRVAITALGGNPHPRATALLIAAATDSDPGVRRRVAVALGERDEASEPGDAPLATLLGTDRWPATRRAAAGALTRRCQRTSPAQALYGAVDRDPDEAVAVTALAALVGCRAPGIETRVLTIAQDRARPAAVRARACVSVGQLAQHVDAAEAARVFERVRSEMLGGAAEALSVAAACATGLGGFRDDATLDALLRAAADAVFPEVQAAAAEALGRRCAPRGRALLSELRGSPQRQVSLAARAAFRRCFR